jgi:hypothetical protein
MPFVKDKKLEKIALHFGALTKLVPEKSIA